MSEEPEKQTPTDRMLARNRRNAERFDKAARIIVQVLINGWPDEWFTLGEILSLIGTWTEPLVIGRYEASEVLRALAIEGNKLVTVRVQRGKREYQVDADKARRRYTIEESKLPRPPKVDADGLVRPTRTPKGSKPK